MRNEKHKKRIPPNFIGKDEMNLLEYCIFSATNRVDRKTKSLVFEDPVFCNIEKRQLIRRLTIAFSAQYGRPTARDDLVMVAMMKKSRDEGFSSQRVHFTRYELLKILGWPENGQNYERIDQALNRIIGTHLVWDNAFWDNGQKSWVDRKFSIIDDVHLYDRDKYDRARERLGETRPQSWFKWSDVMFESFQAGYIKSVDLAALKMLNESVAKRLYRWLDKHFNNPKRKLPIEIPIATLANQKLGFQMAPSSHLQRMLRPAIKELESIAYVAPEAERFVGKGKNCSIRFRPVRKNRRIPDKKAEDLVVEKLGDYTIQARLERRGISKTGAAQLAKKYPVECELQMEHLDFLKLRNWQPSKGDGPWLRAAIVNNFEPPSDFKSSADRRQAEFEKKARDEKAMRRQSQITEHNQKVAKLQRNKINTYLASLTPEEKETLQTDALKHGDAFLVDRLRQLEKDGENQLSAVYLDKLISDYVQSILA